MSMISEQVKEIRNMACVLHDEKRYAAQEIMCQAADTIEALSAKLAAANMERSERYYNSGWILCEDRLPEDGVDVLVWIKYQLHGGTHDGEYTEWYDIGYISHGKEWNCNRIGKVIKWQPLPKEPNKE